MAKKKTVAQVKAEVRKAVRKGDIDTIRAFEEDDRPEVAKVVVDAIDELNEVENTAVDEQREDLEAAKAEHGAGRLLKQQKETPKIKGEWIEMTLEQSKEYAKQKKLAGYNPAKGLGLIIPLALFFIMLFQPFVFAATETALGVGPRVTIEDGVWTPGTSYGAKALYEAAATDDTLVALDSGKTFIVTASSTYTLPTASAGLNYRFVAGDNVTIKIDPQDTDTIKYFPSSLELSAGDIMQSPATPATGDTVELIAVGASSWYVSEINGTWVDGN